MMGRTQSAWHALLLPLLLLTSQGSIGQENQVESMRPGWLGFGFHYFTDGEANQHRGWLFIRGVAPRSPAENAGLRAQDVIVAIDGEGFDESRYSDLLARFAKIKPGQKVELTVRRGTNRLTIPMTAAIPTEDQLERWRVNYRLAQEQEDANDGCCPSSDRQN